MSSQPAIIISSLDAQRLRNMLDSITYQNFPGIDALSDEIDRAKIVAPQEVPPTVVTMNSTVRFTMLEINKANTLTLVYPKDMDGSADKVSVFAPVGIALLGLSVGDELPMPSPTGRVTVRVDAIDYQPENAGELHR